VREDRLNAAGCFSTGKRSDNEGFTLIETLAATMVLAICVVVILQLFAGGLRASRVCDEYTTAIFRAREKMEETLLLEETTEGTEEGVFEDGLRWMVATSLLEDEEEENPLYTNYMIEVAVIWDSGEKERRFALSTTKLGERFTEEGERATNQPKDTTFPF
jgi:general secretion pathway protein I